MSERVSLSKTLSSVTDAITFLDPHLWKLVSLDELATFTEAAIVLARALQRETYERDAVLKHFHALEAKKEKAA